MSKPISTEWRKDQMPEELLELRNHLGALPLHWREKLVPLCERVGQFSRLQGKLVKIAQDAVDQLQLDVKYLLFDLEATRRERDELRQILDELEENEER
ncbi:MAG: transcriptional regulator [Planctomycetes bacterium]|nr:transcriptional regulator [Planctomycetota bacterium]